MSYPPAPPPSGGVNPYGEQPDQAPDPSGPQAPPPPVPSVPQAPADAPWQTPAYGTPPSTPSYGTPPPTYGSPGQSYGGPAGVYSPYTSAARYPGGPGYAGWVTGTRDNGKGTAALVLGILSVVMCFGIGVVLGVIAIVMGVQGRRAVAAGTADNGGAATAGMVLGIIGVSLTLIIGLGYLASPSST